MGMADVAELREQEVVDYRKANHALGAVAELEPELGLEEVALLEPVS